MSDRASTRRTAHKCCLKGENFGLRLLTFELLRSSVHSLQALSQGCEFDACHVVGMFVSMLRDDQRKLCGQSKHSFYRHHADSPLTKFNCSDQRNMKWTHMVGAAAPALDVVYWHKMRVPQSEVVHPPSQFVLLFRLQGPRGQSGEQASTTPSARIVYNEGNMSRTTENLQTTVLVKKYFCRHKYNTDVACRLQTFN